MGDMWFNSSFSSRGVQGLQSQGFSKSETTYPESGAFSLSGTVGLNDILSLEAKHNLLVVPQNVTPTQVNVPGLVRSAVAKDPHGLSLSPETLAFLQDAPMDISQFGLE